MRDYGTIKFFDRVRGFGFVTCDDGKEAFLHATWCDKLPMAGDRVSFNIEPSKTKPGRWQARNVVIEQEAAET